MCTQFDSPPPHIFINKVGLPPPGRADFEQWNGFAKNVPRAALCDEWNAWGALLGAAPAVRAAARGGLPETYTYDLVDIGREVLSQLTIPVSTAHYTALRAASLRADELRATGALYITLLNDLDSLLATDRAFLLGPWLESARRLGAFCFSFFSLFSFLYRCSSVPFHFVRVFIITIIELVDLASSPG